MFSACPLFDVLSVDAFRYKSALTLCRFVSKMKLTFKRNYRSDYIVKIEHKFPYFICSIMILKTET